MMAREQIIEQSRARPADMQQAGGEGAKRVMTVIAGSYFATPGLSSVPWARNWL
jgi:hypothetical protein